MTRHPQKTKIVSEKEIAYLRKQMSHTQRFDLLMKMIRIQRMMATARVIKNIS